MQRSLLLEDSEGSMDIFNYKHFEVAVSLRPTKNPPATGRVPQYITILGARTLPSYELPFGIALRKGGEWSTVQEMLKETHPINALTKLRGNWKRRIEEEIMPLELKLLRRKIEERYAIAEINFGCEPTFEGVYEKKHELKKPVKERLVKAYGEKSKSMFVV